MKSLIWKEWRENLKWAIVPALVIFLPMLLLGGPDEPMFGLSAGFILYLTAAVFGAALGFLQVFFEARGDQRALLLHRPLSRSRIFLGKVVAGLGIYLLALGIPFACVQAWMATPGHMSAPYHWRTGLPWLADILAGLVYYFAGMLTAQREARWYGSRGLGLAAAFLCTFLVWTLPEFWQALVAIALLGTLAGVAAWGSFLAGGAYASQPRLARAALAATFLAGLLVVNFLGKLVVGECFDSGMSHSYTLDRQGRVLIYPWKTGVGPMEPLTDLDGHVPPDLQGKRVDRNLIEEIEAPRAGTEWPTFRSYRNHGRFYVEYSNDSRPGREKWYYAADQGRLLGYDAELHQFLGSFGPDGFVPAGQQPRERFHGELRYPTRTWDTLHPAYLAFPGGIYDVDFARRTLRTLFTPPPGETVLWASPLRDRREKRTLAVVSTDKAVHLLTEAGVPVVSMPRTYDRARFRLNVNQLENPERYVLWYGPSWFLEPEEVPATPKHFLTYDATGREMSRQSVPPRPDTPPSYAAALFGLATPPAELATVAGPIYYLRSEARLSNGMDTWIHLMLLEEWTAHFLPGIAQGTSQERGLLPAFLALSLFSAAVCALICFLLARRYAFSCGQRIGWALCGLAFGPAGLLLMLALEDWPARLACPSCRRPRRVDRERCEHCGAAHAVPVPDSTEIFEEIAAGTHAALAGHRQPARV
jgi:hypothetical protein